MYTPLPALTSAALARVEDALEHMKACADAAYLPGADAGDMGRLEDARALFDAVCADVGVCVDEVLDML